MKFIIQSSKNIVSRILLCTFILVIIPSYSQQEVLSEGQTTKYLYGIASLYSDDFEGQKTVSGVRYSEQGLTAAHRSLPFGTRIEVENLSNGKKVEVIIDDRGPFEQNRILTLSKKSAEILGFASEKTTFVKITILELGTTLPSPMGVPDTNISKDIPQNFNPSSIPKTPVEQEQEQEDVIIETDIDDFDIDEDTFTNINDELAFMDDSFDSVLTNENSELKAQIITNSSIDPIGFDTNVQDFIIDDPLSNIIISPEDEYVIAESPDPSIFDSTPEDITAEEKQILNTNNGEDPFADLFNDNSDPYSFQEEVNSSLMSPTIPNNSITDANHINGDNNTNYPIIPDPIDSSQFSNDRTNTAILTNFVTNVVTITNDIFSSNNIPIENTTDKIGNSQKLKTHFVIQLGAFSKQKNALELYEKLRAKNYNAFITDIKVKGKNLMRVRVGHFNTMEEAIQVSQKLENDQGIENKIIKVEFDDKN